MMDSRVKSNQLYGSLPPPLPPIFFKTNPVFEVILTVHRRYYVEIKRQLDATDDIYCRSYCLLNMFRAILFGALVFKLSV